VVGQVTTLPQTAVAAVATVAAASTFWSEGQSRSRQLTWLEKEFQALQLLVSWPANLLADKAFGPAVAWQRLQQQSGKRMIACQGSTKELQSVVQDLRILGRRLTQANCKVVMVPNDSTDTIFTVPNINRPTWLAQAGDAEQWQEYFTALSTTNHSDAPAFKWFGLSSSGRSFASGPTAPEWLQVLGQHLRPTDILDEDDPSVATDNATEQAILKQQTAFNQALTTGDLSGMLAVCDGKNAGKVTSVVEAGGRLDDWKACLAEGDRPAGMKVADADVTPVTAITAYFTCIEFPAAMEGATLLAVQEWVLCDGMWRLAKHETIPWADRSAAGILICDCRGCVSLVRTAEKRTFGGLLG